MGNIDFFYLRCIKCMKRRHKLDTFVFLDMSDQILITGAKAIDLYKYCTYFEFHGHILVSIPTKIARWQSGMCEMSRFQTKLRSVLFTFDSMVSFRLARFSQCPA